MSALGFNVIRLIFVWEAYEPVEGQRNQRYIEMLRAIIREAWRHHIYTLLDFHQDGYARFLAKGCGEGFPRWTIPQSPGWVAALGMAGLDAPDNSAACADWMMKAFADPKVYLSFQALYHSTLIKRYTEVVGDLVSRLGNEPGVIGFDPLNEPFSALGSWDPNYANAFRSPSPLDRILPDLVTRQRLIEQDLSNF
jgi:endoglycosylceramidase